MMRKVTLMVAGAFVGAATATVVLHTNLVVSSPASAAPDPDPASGEGVRPTRDADPDGVIGPNHPARRLRPADGKPGPGRGGQRLSEELTTTLTRHEPGLPRCMFNGRTTGRPAFAPSPCNV